MYLYVVDTKLLGEKHRVNMGVAFSYILEKELIGSRDTATDIASYTVKHIYTAGIFIWRCWQ